MQLVLLPGPLPLWRQDVAELTTLGTSHIGAMIVRPSHNDGIEHCNQCPLGGFPVPLNDYSQGFNQSFDRFSTRLDQGFVRALAGIHASSWGAISPHLTTQKIKASWIISPLI